MARFTPLSILTVASTLALAASGPSTAPERRAFSIGQSVKTSSGTVSGHAAPVAKNVSEYLGIPYAQPPVGQLRFAAPVAYKSSGKINGGSFGATCASNGVLGDPGVTGPAYPYHDTVNWGPQGIKLLNNEAQANYPSGEDCLTVNVWTKPQTGEAKKAVMVWIYGGGFNFGSDQDPWYNGQYLADRQDVVVVSVNYRTNIFGFPGAPGLPNQNAGLLDQRLAVEWVRDNIAGFGGDPSRITLFGQSAGGASVDLYSFAWYNKDPIINGMFMMSGTAFFASPRSNSSAEATWWQTTDKLGCGNALSPNQSAVLACMRSKTTREILNATSAQPGLSQIATISQFAPVVDGVTGFDDYGARAAEGRFIKKPLLIGNTDDEGGIAQPVAQALYSQPIPQPIIDFVNQAGFNCPTGTRAKYQVSNGLPTWRYRWFGTWANTVVSYNKPDSGAYHESDIPVVFGSTVNQNYSVPDSAVEKSVVAYYQAAYAAFAKDPQNGLTKYGWSRYDGTNNLLQLAKANSTGPNPTTASTYDAGCDLIDLPGNLQALFQQAGDMLKAAGYPNSTSKSTG